jgi:hypothetical protein
MRQSVSPAEAEVPPFGLHWRGSLPLCPYRHQYHSVWLAEVGEVNRRSVEGDDGHFAPERLQGQSHDFGVLEAVGGVKIVQNLCQNLLV